MPLTEPAKAGASYGCGRRAIAHSLSPWLFPWSPGFARPDAARQGGFDAILEGLRAQDTALVSGGPYLLEQTLVQMFLAQGPIGSVPLLGRAAQCQVEGMVRDDGIELATRMPPITGPGIVSWVLHHAR